MRARAQRRKTVPATATAVPNISAPPAPPPTRTVLLICAALAIAILAIYAQTFKYGFVAYDDNVFVSANPIVKSGLNAASFKYAFTTWDYSNWHPLTVLTYLLDVQLFGVNPGEEHVVNVLLHIGSTILLFLALLQMTGKLWRCAFVAAVFAVHPLHVESVAWIAERKDVLSTFFEMMALLFYVRYARRRSVGWYLAVAVAFALSLLSKPMTITWPVILLLLDFWPLKRFGLPLRFQSIRGPVLEKLPLLAMAAVVSVLTVIAQGSAMASLGRIPLYARLENVAVAYFTYVLKAFWPPPIAVLYPFQVPDPAAVLVSLILVLAVTFVALAVMRSKPYLTVGWLWYLITLLPVIGFIQVGNQAIADRYTYVPFVGLSIAVTWIVAESIREGSGLRKAIPAIAGIWLIVSAGIAFQTASYWKNSETLFAHTITATTGNFTILNNLGVIYQAEGRYSEAADLYRQALATNPRYADGKNNLGSLAEKDGHVEEAIGLYREAVALEPGNAKAHENLGVSLIKTGHLHEAEAQLREATRLDPQSSKSHAFLGLVLAASGQLEEAQRNLEQAIAIAPGDAAAHGNLCWVLNKRGRPAEAMAQCRQTISIIPTDRDAHFNLANSLAAQGNRAEAIEELKQVLKLHPGDAEGEAMLKSLGGGK